MSEPSVWSRPWGLPLVVAMLVINILTIGVDIGTRDQELKSLERSVAGLQQSVALMNRAIGTDNARLDVLEKLEALRDKEQPPLVH